MSPYTWEEEWGKKGVEWAQDNNMFILRWVLIPGRRSGVKRGWSGLKMVPQSNIVLRKHTGNFKNITFQKVECF